MAVPASPSRSSSRDRPRSSPIASTTSVATHNPSGPATSTCSNEVLLLQREALGADHLAVAETLNYIGCALTHVDDSYAAMVALKEALWIREHRLEEDRPRGRPGDSTESPPALRPERRGAGRPTLVSTAQGRSLHLRANPRPRAPATMPMTRALCLATTTTVRSLFAFNKDLTPNECGTCLKYIYIHDYNTQFALQRILFIQIIAITNLV